MRELPFAAPRRGRALGRTGPLTTAGLRLARIDHELVLWPVTPAGTIGPCWLTIPMPELPRLLDALERLLAEAPAAPAPVGESSPKGRRSAEAETAGAEDALTDATSGRARTR